MRDSIPAFVRKKSLIYFLVCASAIVSASPMHQHHSSPLQLRSSDSQLGRAFEWAKEQALSYVRDQDPVGPWYEAALPGRQAFCMRDVSHQAAGGEALGLSEHTYNMLHKFAENIAASRDWCTFWEMDRLNRPAPVDYESDQKFWYCLPASFDVLDACYRMFLWTGDRRYIDDPAMLNFYRRTVSDYVAKWDLSPEAIMDRHVAIRGARGIPSYNEGDYGITAGVDLLAAQSAAYRSYASILDARGDRTGADHYRKEGAKVLRLIDSRWWNPTAQAFYGLLTTGHRLTLGAGSSLLYWDAISVKTKLEVSVRQLAASSLARGGGGVEELSYYPEILYRFGFVEEAYGQILDLAREGRPRREYPEVSFAIIGAVARGLMGVNVEPAGGKNGRPVIRTLSGLGVHTAWAELEGLPVQGVTLTIRHDGGHSSALKNLGSRPVLWRATFPGTFPGLSVNGKRRAARHLVAPIRRPLTFVDIEVKPGESVHVEAGSTQVR
ncbi:MAG: hypothetical protein ACHQ50_14745 [Fimbriimonadales bacterium]